MSMATILTETINIRQPGHLFIKTLTTHISGRIKPTQAVQTVWKEEVNIVSNIYEKPRLVLAVLVAVSSMPEYKWLAMINDWCLKETLYIYNLWIQ